MNQRIAPNNQLPATHFIEAFNWEKGDELEYSPKPRKICDIDLCLALTKNMGGTTIAIFRIRQNKLPTKHKF